MLSPERMLTFVGDDDHLYSRVTAAIENLGRSNTLEMSLRGHNLCSRRPFDCKFCWRWKGLSYAHGGLPGGQQGGGGKYVVF